MSPSASTRLLYFVLITAGVATIVAAIVFFAGRGDRPAPAGETARHTVTGKPLYSATESKRRVTLFFPSPEGGVLLSQEREIYATAVLSNQLKQVVVELIKGPDPTGSALPALPDATKLREVYVKGDTAYVDLTQEFNASFSGGSEVELLTVYSIVDSLAINFESVRQVKLLVEGAEIQAVGAHIDLSRPLAKDFGYVAAKTPPA